MKTPILLVVLALAGSAVAGVTSRDIVQSSDSASCRTHRSDCAGMKSTGTPGAYYRSNFFRNAVLVCNDTPNFMTFFVYFGDMPGPNGIDGMVRIGANVYQVTVEPYRKSFLDQRSSCYWVSARPGKWGIDLSERRIVRE